MGIKEWVVPQDGAFFDLFEQMTAILTEASGELVALIANFDEVTERSRTIEDLEHKGDRVSHEIYEHLNRTFITPLEPWEITTLISALDDVLDYIDGAAQMMHNYDIGAPDQRMIDLAGLIQKCAIELAGAVYEIRHIRDPKTIETRCIEVNRLENIADTVLSQAIIDLFRTGDAVLIIKKKDIYEYLEIATDKCEDVANVLSDIAIRHS